jgi:hypothetical protein
MTARRFPPWSVEEEDACFLIRDRGGQVGLPATACFNERETI